MNLTREHLDELTRRLTDEGKLIAAGFAGFAISCIPADAPREQINDMEAAFMCGAQHLWASVFGILSGENEPTEADLRRMELIGLELASFAEWLKRRINGEAH